MYEPRPAAAFFPFKLGYISVLAVLKGIKRMLRCCSSCSALVFVLNKTSQASDDVPKDHLHKRLIYSFKRSNQHEWAFFSIL